MTLIVYKDGVMAADSASWKGDIIVGFHQKVEKSPDGWLLGCLGDVYCIQIYTHWFMSGREGKPPKECSDMTAVFVSPEGVINVACQEHKMASYAATGPYVAFGYGCEFAYGCLVAGLSAVETVANTIERSAYLGGKVCSETLLSYAPKRKRNLRNRKGG